MKKTANLQFFLYRSIHTVYLAVFFSISLLVLFINPFMDHYAKKTFMFSNTTLLFIDLLSFILILWVWTRIRPHVSKIIDRHADRYILIFSLILLCIQIYISYNIFFATGWDVGGAVIPAAKLIASGNSLESVNPYFSRYPNNIVLVWIFSELIKLKNSIPLIAASNDLAVIIVMNCLISTLTGVLTYKTVKHLVNTYWALFAWMVYVLLIGLSPWMVITYSDALALCFPLWIYYIYIHEWGDRFPAGRWIMVGILSMLGYQIKPQVIIILIAILIIEGVKLLDSTLKEKRNAAGIAALLLIMLMLSGSIKQLIIDDANFALDKEDIFGWSHFVMMGLNDETDGVYSEDDVIFSHSFATAADRKNANLAEVKSRLNTFGLWNYLNFLSRKTLVNYGDGTFAWGLEGRFYMETYEDQDPWISPLLKSFYYHDGENYRYTSTSQQALWIFIVVSLLGLAFMDKSRLGPRLLVLMLALVGLTLFELIFESRARYLYIYAPMYIALSAVGLRSIVGQIRHTKNQAFRKPRVQDN